uniref:Magnesium-dependent phosphatase 1-like n=1 Tax=Nelumbo nucifera TaxID=4432 RepID=A0A822XR13_NELNU|nr:TPA_asm: hypothetical protein HUJ06_023576 [Nelumbo nucifera]
MGDEKVKDDALKMLGLFQVLPRLVVFDLDYTLWPFYCECRSKREMPSLYPHAKGILHALKDKGIDVAVASRSPTPDIAKTFLDKLGIQSMFVAQTVSILSLDQFMRGMNCESDCGLLGSSFIVLSCWSAPTCNVQSTDTLIKRRSSPVGPTRQSISKESIEGPGFPLVQCYFSMMRIETLMRFQKWV